MYVGVSWARCMLSSDRLPGFCSFTTSVGSCQSASGAIVNYCRWRDLIYIRGVVDGIGPRSWCWQTWLLKKALLLVKDRCLCAGSSLGFPLLGTGPPLFQGYCCLCWVKSPPFWVHRTHIQILTGSSLDTSPREVRASIYNFEAAVGW